MSIWKWILAIIIIIVLGLLVLWALPPTRAATEGLLGPPIMTVGGGVVDAISTSVIWREWIVPFPNQMLILGAILWLPIFWLFLRSRTKLRQVVQRGAAKDSGFAVPVSTPTIAPTPTGATTRPAETPTPATTTPTTNPATTQPEKPEEAK